ncbi:hypothetical protein D3C87_1636740 [compost metagenome]
MDEPTLIRLTPSALNSATVNFTPLKPITTLTGLGASACTTWRISSLVRKPGAYNTSAPASANACRRAMVSSRSRRPFRKFSARAVSMNGNGKPRAAATAASTRATACANG